MLNKIWAEILSKIKNQFLHDSERKKPFRGGIFWKNLQWRDHVVFTILQKGFYSRICPSVGSFVVYEQFTDADYDELEINTDTLRNTLKEFVQRQLLKIGNSPRGKIDCGQWTPEQVRDHIQRFGTFCEGLAEGLYQESIPGFGLQSTHPQKILDDFADHFSNSKGKLKHSLFL